MSLVQRIVSGLLGVLLLGMVTGGSNEEAHGADWAMPRSHGELRPSGNTVPGFHPPGRPLFSPPPFIDRSTPISERPFATPFIDRGPSFADRPLSPIGEGGRIPPMVMPHQQMVSPGQWVWCRGHWVWADGHWHDGDVCSTQ